MISESELNENNDQLNQPAKKLYLIDGYGFVFRAYHSMPPLTAPDGTPVGAIYGFTNMLMKLIQELRQDSIEDYICMVFDSGKKTFRNDIYPEYKANRPDPPDDLKVQFPLLREVADALNIKSVEQVGYEADDLIATYTRIAKEQNIDVVIVSSDKDLMQLVEDSKVQMFDAMRSKDIGVKQVEEKFGVLPEKVLDVLALMGDSSDNIPGVPGIGPKTATELVNQYGSLEEVLANADKIKQKKRSQVLQENKDQARLSKELVKLCDTVPIENKIEDFAFKEIEQEYLVEFLRKYGFKSLVSRVEKKFGNFDDKKHVYANNHANNNLPLPRQIKEAIEISKIQNINELQTWLDEQRIEAEIFIDFEFGLHGPIKICIGYDHHIQSKLIGCWFNLESQESNEQAGFDLGLEEQTNDNSGLNQEKVLKILQPLLTNPAILKIGHDLKSIMRRCKLNIHPYHDVGLMSYVLDNSKHEHKFSNIVNANLGEDYGEEAEEKIVQLKNVYTCLKQRIFSENCSVIYEKVERPLVAVLADMERAGVKIDPKELKNQSDSFIKKISGLEEEIFQTAGEEFNIGSPKQLGEILFEKMGIEGGKKSKKSGFYSASQSVLEELSVQGHDIADKVLDWRHLTKLKNTYLDALPKSINDKTGRVHTSFEMTVTSTGRLSSRDPNLQNIPIRTDDGKKIRQAFVAEKGSVLISADYSQIELRLLAHIAEIESLKKAFREGQDIHSITAHEVFGIPLDQVDAEHRRRAKTINFGIIYGLSAFGLSQRLKIERSVAKEYIDSYFAKYPGILEYMERTKEYAKKHGFVKTIWGRRCYIKGVNDKNFAMRNFAERAAINAPLQGTAADIIKKAMVKISAKFKEKRLKSEMILQVHDELLIESPEDEAEQVTKIVKKLMEEAIILSVPIIAEVNTGNNWGEIH